MTNSRLSYLFTTESDLELLDSLYKHFNVGRVSLPAGSLPPTVDLPVVRDGSCTPSRLLAAYQIDGHPKQEPLLLPIDDDIYARAFCTSLSKQPCVTSIVNPSAFSSPPPSPLLSSPAVTTITLPISPVAVPDVASLPLLLFALFLESHVDSLAYHLLPCRAVSEFPNASAMACALARNSLHPEVFERVVRRNFGMWGNMLALGLEAGRLEKIVRLCWNVTAEAKRLRGASV